MKNSTTRSQKELTLDNQLQVLLISDSQINKSSCAMDVAVGSLEDPIKHQGLAHFLEHMLFLGTEKYPEVDEYNNYLHSHKGYSNAYTASENTNYYFEIEHSAFQGALDRFSQFFIAPLFNQEFVERELNAVNSEHKKNWGDDDWRLRMILKTQFSKNHAARKFSTGDAQTLSQVKRDELIEFYQKNYSANQMKLVLMSCESLENMESWATDFFSAIKNQQRQKHTYPSQVFDTEKLPMKVEVKSVADIHKIELVFATPSCHDYIQTKPESLITHLIGHEGPGSILSKLKQMNLATELVAWHENYSFGGFFHFNIDLTNHGYEKIPEVLKIFFSYVNLLKQNHLPDYITKEKRHMAQVNFDYREPREGGGFVSQMASRMHHLPALEIEASIALIPEDNQDHLQLFLSHISPKDMTLLVQSKDMATDQIEPYYQASYKTTKISDSLMVELESYSYQKELSLPSQNVFIPTTFKKPPEATEQNPEKIFQEDWGVFYHQDDYLFQLPKAQLGITHINQKIHSSPQQKVLTLLYIMSLNEMLNEWKYDVSLGGIDFDVSIVKKGIQVNMSGYVEHIPKLMSHLGKKLTEIEIPESRFVTIKENLKQDIQNTFTSHAYSQTIYEIKNLVTPNFIHRKDLYFATQNGEVKVNLVDDITLDEVKQHAKDLYDQLEIEGCSYGPLDVKVLKETFKQYPQVLKVKTREQKSHTKNLSIDLVPGKQWTYQTSTYDQNHCFARYIQFGKRDFSLNAAIRVGMCLLEPTFYEEMRTRQQLGYIAHSSLYFTDTALGLLLLIQSSSHTPDDMSQRVQKYLDDFQTRLASLSKEKWETFKNSVAQELREKEETISEKFQTLHSETLIFDNQYNYKEQVAKACEKVTPEQVRDVYLKAFEKETRKAIEVQMYKVDSQKRPSEEQSLITSSKDFKKDQKWH